jgi:Hemerythrin HHE cation binding domain
MKITDALLVEHGLLCVTLDFVAKYLRQVKELTEVKLLAGMLERLLDAHGKGEEHFMMVPFDHILEDHGQREQMRLAHLEIDGRLNEVQSATNLTVAKRLLKDAISTTRKHFKSEEEVVFPQFEKLLTVSTLNSLGKAMIEERGRR